MNNIIIGGKSAPVLPSSFEKAFDGKKETPKAFGQILEGMIKGVDTLQQKANEEIMKVQSEKSGSIHEVMIAMEKADISFRTMMQVRNKLLEAYQEVMRLQV
jgi:flagellar hook-basal body complex protein FliE